MDRYDLVPSSFRIRPDQHSVLSALGRIQGDGRSGVIRRLIDKEAQLRAADLAEYRSERARASRAARELVAAIPSLTKPPEQTKTPLDNQGRL